MKTYYSNYRKQACWCPWCVLTRLMEWPLLFVPFVLLFLLYCDVTWTLVEALQDALIPEQERYPEHLPEKKEEPSLQKQEEESEWEKQWRNAYGVAPEQKEETKDE